MPCLIATNLTIHWVAREKQWAECEGPSIQQNIAILHLRRQGLLLVRSELRRGKSHAIATISMPQRCDWTR